MLVFQYVLPQIGNPFYSEARKQDPRKDKIASLYVTVLYHTLSEHEKYDYIRKS